MKIYHLNAPGPYYTNSFVLIGENRHAAVIDACAALDKYLSVLKENDAELVYILETHGHSDHTGTVEALKERTNARVMIAKADADLFGVKADEYFADGQKIEFDDVRLEVITTPGHTPGSVCLLNDGLLFSGDTLFSGDIGRTDLEGGSYTDIMKSLHKLLGRVQGDPQVLPGHDEFTTFENEKLYNRYLR